jgi:outer membrane immunogenic protein
VKLIVLRGLLVATSTLSARNLFDIALGVAASATAATSASAQTPNWTGFYIGGHGGYRWADAQVSSGSYTFTGAGDTHPGIPGANGNFDLKSFIGGPHAGYNWQYAPNFLVGIEGDLDFGSAKKSIAQTFLGVDTEGDGFIFNSNSTVKLGWQGTIRGRLGYIANNWLFYGTGGVAFAKVKWQSSWSLVGDDFVGANTVSAEKTLTGWVVGGGVETMMTPNILVRAEYLAEGFKDFTVPQGIGQVGTLDLDTIHKFRIGISFKTP